MLPTPQFFFLLLDFFPIMLYFPLCISNAGNGGRGLDVMFIGGISALLGLSLGAVERLQYPGGPKNSQDSDKPEQVDRSRCCQAGHCGMSDSVA